MLSLRLLLLLLLIDRCWSLYEIEWSSCFKGSTRVCYADTTCFTTGNKNSSLEQIFEDDKLINVDPANPNRKKCDIGVQTRTFSDKKLLVFLQMIGKGPLAGASPSELALYQGNALVAGCKRTSEGVELMGQDERHSLVLYKDATHFVDNHIVCAFTIYRPAEFKKSFNPQAKFASALRFSDGTSSPPKTIPFWQKGIFVLDLSAVTCDPEEIIMQRSIEDHHVVPIKDINRDQIDCSNQESSLGYELKYVDVNATSTEIKSVSCIQLETLEYAWHIVFKTSRTPLIVDDPQLFAFACATKISKMCGNPLKCSGSDCPVFNNGTESSDAKISCPGGKWIIDGDYHEGIQPVCKAEMTKMNTANFYINLGESEVDFTDGKCFKNFDCDLKSHLEFSNCEKEEDGCVVLVKDSKQIHCKNGQNVSVQVRQENKTMSASEFNCDVSSGQWKDPSGVAIPEFSLVLCPSVAKTVVEAESNIMELVYPVGGVLIGLAILIVPIYIFCSKREKKSSIEYFEKSSTPEYWKKLKTKKQLKRAREVFNEVCKGDSQSATIVHGLRILDLLLESEVERPAIWKVAQKFLWRLRSAVQNYDQALYEQLGRYLFLRAKLIIDKHGWISQEPVTKGNLNGYIITVAVQLLGNAMYSSSTNDDAENLIVEGFRQLRFAGESAYPQCGVLWSLMTQIVVPPSVGVDAQEFDDMNSEFFGLMESTDRCKMAGKDVIPQHGCVKQQAFAAIACSTPYSYCETYILNWVKHERRKWFLDGLFRNIFYPDPAALLIFKWKTKPKKAKVEPGTEKPKKEPNKNLVTAKKLLGDAAFDKLFDRMKEALAYNMKIVDSRIMEVLQVYPKKQPPSEKYAELRYEVTAFYSSLEAQADSVGSWLTEANKRLETRPSETKTIVCERKLVQLITSDYSGLPAIDAVNPVLKPVPMRPRTCTVSRDMQNLCNKLLDRMRSKRSFCGDPLEYSSTDVLDVVLAVRPILEQEPILIEDVPADTYVVADLHGQLHDLYRYLTSVNSPDEIPGYKGGRQFVFTGDYVDRGSQSVEVTITLFALKILYPEKFILLRGNHEDVTINKNNGFLEELMKRFGKEIGQLLYKQYNITFSFLSFAAIIGGKVFCTHGGPSVRPVNKQYFRKCHKPVFLTGDITVLHDLLWGDPAIGLTGSCYNSARDTSVFYSETVLDFFLKAMGCTTFIRGHQVMTKGYQIIWNRLFSLFSAATEDATVPEPHGAAIIHVTADCELQVLVSEPNTKRQEARALAENDANTKFVKNKDTPPEDGTGEVTVVDG